METKKNVPYVDLPVFQGPLELLLHLIQQNKVDIYDIPIALIADQFIETVKKMEELDIEVASEFLVLAAQLLYLKSRSLLPQVQKSEEELMEEEELKLNLVDRLVTYRAFKNLACYLGSKEMALGKRYFREINLEEITATFKSQNPLKGISLEDIFKAFRQVLERVERGETIHYIEADEVPVELMMNDILRRIILSTKGVSFSQLLHYRSRVEIVVAFIALLELLKNGKIRAEQSGHSKDIFLVPTDRAWEFAEEESV